MMVTPAAMRGKPIFLKAGLRKVMDESVFADTDTMRRVLPDAKNIGWEGCVNPSHPTTV